MDEVNHLRDLKHGNPGKNQVTNPGLTQVRTHGTQIGPRFESRFEFRFELRLESRFGLEPWLEFQLRGR